LLEPDEADLALAMRQRENTGRLLGDEPFLKKLQALLARKLLPGNPARPKKTRKQYGDPGFSRK